LDCRLNCNTKYKTTQDGELVMHLRYWDVWEEADGWDGIPPYEPRYMVIVVRSAIQCMPQHLSDDIVITPGTDCTCIADHMVDEFRPLHPLHTTFALGAKVVWRGCGEAKLIRHVVSDAHAGGA
jgi:hypothetical protein